MFHPYEQTSSGVEVHVAVNALAPFNLALELLEALTQRNGRVVNVTSVCQYAADLPAFLHDEADSPPTPYLAYANSKLLLTLLTQFLAEHIAAVEFVAGHPGMQDTHFTLNSRWYILQYYATGNSILTNLG